MPSMIFSQMATVTDQYVLNPLTINPAYAGNRGVLNMAAFYRKQWVGVTGSPEMMTLALDMPLFHSKLGMGALISRDKTGVSGETRFSTSYAYRIYLENGSLSFGLGAGIIATNTAWSDLRVVDEEDSHYLVNSHVFAVPDFSFGIYLMVNKFFAGFSIPKLVGYDFDFKKNMYGLNFDMRRYNYLFNTGYLFDLSPKTKFFPSALVSYIPDQGLMYDINAHLIFSDKIWTGVSYHNNRSFCGLLQLSISNQLKIAYTYDFDIQKMGRYSNGSHEVMLRYELKYKIESVNPLLF